MIFYTLLADERNVMSSIPESMKKNIKDLKQYAAGNNIELPWSDEDLRVYLNLTGRLSNTYVSESSHSNNGFDNFVHLLSSDAMINHYEEVIKMIYPDTTMHIPVGRRIVFANRIKADLLAISTIHALLIDSTRQSIE